MTISERITDILSKKRLKQKDLSAYIDISTSTLNDWLKLNRSIPSEFIIPISEFLDVTPNYLLTGQEDTNITTLSRSENELIANYRELNNEGIKYINSQMDIANHLYKRSEYESRFDEVLKQADEYVKELEGELVHKKIVSWAKYVHLTIVIYLFN